MSNQIVITSSENPKRLNELYTQAVLDLIQSRFSTSLDEIDYLIEVLKEAKKQEDV